jgi:hypothetical protein
MKMQAVHSPEADIGEKRNAYRVPVGDSEGKRLLGRPRHKSK